MCSIYGPLSLKYDQPGPKVGSLKSLDLSRFLNRKQASLHKIKKYKNLQYMGKQQYAKHERSCLLTLIHLERPPNLRED